MVRADDEPPVGVLAEVIDEHGMFDRVEDVFVSDVVTAGCWVNLHTSILYYKKNHWDSFGVAHSVSSAGFGCDLCHLMPAGRFEVQFHSASRGAQPVLRVGR